MASAAPHLDCRCCTVVIKVNFTRWLPSGGSWYTSMLDADAINVPSSVSVCAAVEQPGRLT